MQSRCLILVAWAAFAMAQPPSSLDVKASGAKGDGATLDTAAINGAIDAANAAGGGTVYFPPGTYVTGSIHLKSNVTLYLEQGSTIEASTDPNVYDEAEPNASDKFQDFGHSHFRNSLIWGENLHDIAIIGQGVIYGKGLTRSANKREGNKAVSLKLCRNVLVRDVSFLMAGHFAILATGVDNLTIDNIKIDTNRDGIDVDSCRHVRISNVSANTPWDDAIVIKGSHALGFARDTEDVTITNCEVSGFENGTFLNGTYKRSGPAPERNGPTGRIKIGTESEGGFKNITISNCVFDYSRGLALETVDGAQLEDVSISNITMRDIANAPIYVRLGRRMRAPEGVPVGSLKRVNISDVTVYNADARYASMIMGIPGHDIEDLRLRNIRIYYAGGGTKEQAAIDVSEKETEYPEPYRQGEMPAYGFFVRHVKGLEMSNVEVSYLKDDARPAFVLDDVKGAELNMVHGEHASGAPVFRVKDVSTLVLFRCGVPDVREARVDRSDY